LGYASEGVRLLIDYLFSNRPLERIEAVTGAENLPSKKLLENLGFTLEGRTRKSYFVRGEYTDSLHYGLLREEWGSRPPT
jgi:aminoglycoside 6'-N-acetyltransferase